MRRRILRARIPEPPGCWPFAAIVGKRGISVLNLEELLQNRASDEDGSGAKTKAILKN
jgi:hypothetical protein